MKSRTTDQLCSDIHITLLSWITAVHFSNQSSLIAALQFKRYSTVYMSDIFSHLAEMNGTFLNVLIQKRFSKYVKLIETVATKLKPNLLFEVKRNIQVQIPDWADTFCLMSRALGHRCVSAFLIDAAASCTEGQHRLLKPEFTAAAPLTHCPPTQLLTADCPPAENAVEEQGLFNIFFLTPLFNAH